MAEGPAAIIGSIISAFVILFMIATLASVPMFSSTFAPIINGITGAAAAVCIVGVAVIIAVIAWIILKMFFEG